MKIEIKNRLNGSVLFSIEAKSLKIALEIAVQNRADLRSADLRYANLRSANLSSANLRSANLRSADLHSADLSYANLRSADLRYANLRSANLSSANLRSANLRSADLRSANLSSAVGINRYLCTPLEILREQVGEIRAYKLVDANLFGVYYPKIKYIIGKTLKVKRADENERVQCGKGISLATLDWCMKEWHEGLKILVCAFTSKDIAAIPVATDGKFRVRKCKVIKEVDLEKIGLMNKQKQGEE